MEKTKLQHKIEVFNEKVAGEWDLEPSYWDECFTRVSDGKVFVSTHYYIPYLEEGDEKLVENDWLTVLGEVELTEKGAFKPERITFPAMFDFHWNDKEGEWRLEGWNIPKGKNEDEFEF